MTRVALIGAGFAVAPHLAALSRAGYELGAVATRDPARLAAVQAVFPHAVGCWPPTEAMAPGTDLVMVLSPASSHIDVVREAAARKLDVLVEKPLDIDLGRAVALVRVADDAGIGLAVCYQHRAKPAAVALRSIIDGGELGEIVSGAATAPYWREQSYYDEPGRGSLERDGGGVLIVQGVHILDLAVHLLGAPQRVIAVTGRSPVHQFETEDLVSAVLDYGSGRSVTLSLTTARFPGFAESLDLGGSAGSARLEGAELRAWVAPDATARTIVGLDDAASLDPVGWYRTIIEDAVRSFAERGEPIASGASALRTQQVVAALYESAATGEWVSVPSGGVR